MTCPHATAISAQVNACGLGLYGGRPSAGVCKLCVSRGEHKTLKPPSLPQMANSLFKAAVEETIAIAEGHEALKEAERNRRLALCKGCDRYVIESGRCVECGCFMGVKTKLRTASCPLGKW
jgi:hypothetical protein